MGRLIAIEGLDGAGKRTLTAGLVERLTALGARVACDAFPRYGRDVHADLVAEALHNRHGDLLDSAYGMGLLYALDRRAARDDLLRLLDTHDVLLLDRYVASNAAYQAARLHQGADGEVVEWVRELEIARFALPVPAAHLLLDVPVELASARARWRAEENVARVRDAYETDGGLQARCAGVYRELAAAAWLCPWHVLSGGEPPDDLAATLLGD